MRDSVSGLAIYLGCLMMNCSYLVLVLLEPTPQLTAVESATHLRVADWRESLDTWLEQPASAATVPGWFVVRPSKVCILSICNLRGRRSQPWAEARGYEWTGRTQYCVVHRRKWWKMFLNRLSKIEIPLMWLPVTFAFLNYAECSIADAARRER